MFIALKSSHKEVEGFPNHHIVPGLVLLIAHGGEEIIRVFHRRVLPGRTLRFCKCYTCQVIKNMADNIMVAKNMAEFVKTATAPHFTLPSSKQVKYWRLKITAAKNMADFLKSATFWLPYFDHLRRLGIILVLVNFSQVPGVILDSFYIAVLEYIK